MDKITNLQEIKHGHYDFINAPYKNTEFDAENTFFTADLHIGHKNIIRFCKRPYVDVKIMSEEIRKVWNEKIPVNANVFIMGDCFFSISKFYAKQYLDSLNGKKHLVLGNHDNLNSLPLECFEHISLQDQIVIKSRSEECEYNYNTLILSHYPLYSWAGIMRGVYNLFGHEHNSIPNSEYLLTQMDVGWDTIYAPWSWNEIVNAFTQRVIDNDGRALKGF